MSLETAVGAWRNISIALKIPPGVASLFAASIANAGRGVAEPSETSGRKRVTTSERRGTASVPRDTLQVR